MRRFATAMRRIDERIPGADLPLLSVSQTRGVLRRSELTGDEGRAESLDMYKVTRAGDVVFNKMSVRAGAMGVVPEDGLVTYHYEVMRPIGDTDARYIVYLMKSAWFTGELVARERGIGAGEQANVRTTEVPFTVLGKIRAWIPDPDEQRAIANYLDAETAKIDALIAEQKRLVETLRERRSAIIQREIDDADGGLVPLKHRFSVTDCKHVTAEFVDADEAYPLVSIRECQSAVIDLTSAKRTTKEYFDLLREGERAPRPGDLVMTRNASVGLVARVTDETPPFAMGQDVCLLRRLAPGLVEPRYAQYALRSPRAVEQFELKMIGSTFRRINVEDIRSLMTRWPSVGEQRRIADYLDDEAAKIDTLIVKTERFIGLARERRAALITAAVTGQIDVRTAGRRDG